MNENPHTPQSGPWGRLIAGAMNGPLVMLGVIGLIAAGLVALAITPREEEPQIIVPLADVLVSAPGLGARQVERQVSTPLEKLLSQIDGVEHVYSMSQPGRAIVTVRFYVGEDREDSLVKVFSKLESSRDQVPAVVRSWVVKPLEVDDVPIVVASLWSDDPERVGGYTLRRLAEEMAHRLKAIDSTNRVTVTGGNPRRIRVELDPAALASRRTTPLQVADAIEAANFQQSGGVVSRKDHAIVVEAGTFIADAAALERLVVNVLDGAPVQLRDVARVHDGPAEPTSYTWTDFGPASTTEGRVDGPYPAVFLAVAKRKGSNAVWVAEETLETLERLHRELFPPEVHFQIIRNYGETADQKVDDLVSSLAVAMLTVVVFIAVFLGWRQAVVVAVAVPVSYGITLLLDLLTGYTINRVTLFALILALGLLVDDPITGVDNISRYLRMGGRSARDAVVDAMLEVRSALLLSTVAVILAFAPMFFITGMMGPYMAPMAFNVPVAVTASTLVAFLFTPWLAYRMLRHVRPEADYDITRTALYRVYAVLVAPLIASRRRAWAFLAVVALLFLLAAALPLLRAVPLKLLPFDNKDEFQVLVDAPEGTTLERTQSVVAAAGRLLASVPEVESISGFAGVPSPMDFNGLVRHYYLREAPHLGELRVTLAGRHARSQQSHEVVLRLRRELAALGREHHVLIKLVEVPPGPPVISTLTAEIYGHETTDYAALRHAARTLATRLEREPYVVDVDTSVEDDQRKLVYVADKEKAALAGVTTREAAATVALATAGQVAGHLQLPSEANPLPIELRLPMGRRNAPGELGALHVATAGTADDPPMGDAPPRLAALRELGHFAEHQVDKTIYHKNLRPVAYVYADAAGRTPAEIIADLAADQDAPATAAEAPRPLDERSFIDPGGGIPWSLPAGVNVEWGGEGEWQITLRVFRDLGIAFGVALVGIFVVLMIQTGLPSLSLIIMLAIPLTVIGIMPGFWLLNQLGDRIIDGQPNPALFTATAMIGMIALAGIVVRNSLVLVQFVQLELGRGAALRDALLTAGAVRMRPVVLTAVTTLLGNVVITLDPIFSGLAWAVIFGISASTVFTLAVVPVAYFLVYGESEAHQSTGQRSPVA
ncbi:MAG: efflux RND transporter permease subunit [Gammaproteobacteria bacterium]|nr:efflux RND transporter permease subunit [Gammaproteobacteria bacterium]